MNTLIFIGLLLEVTGGLILVFNKLRFNPSDFIIEQESIHQRGRDFLAKETTLQDNIIDSRLSVVGFGLLVIGLVIQALSSIFVTINIPYLWCFIIFILSIVLTWFWLSSVTRRIKTIARDEISQKYIFNLKNPNEQNKTKARKIVNKLFPWI